MSLCCGAAAADFWLHSLAPVFLGGCLAKNPVQAFSPHLCLSSPCALCQAAGAKLRRCVCVCLCVVAPPPSPPHGCQRGTGWAKGGGSGCSQSPWPLPYVLHKSVLVFTSSNCFFLKANVPPSQECGCERTVVTSL